MRSSNPILSRDNSFRTSPTIGGYGTPALAVVTMDSVIMRSAMMLGTLVLFGAGAWILNVPMVIAFVASIVAFVIAIVASFKRSTSPALFLTYAALQGLAMGVISNMYENAYKGIVMQAVLGVIIVFGVMLALYKTKIVKVTSKFTRVLMTAAIAYIILMLVNLGASFFIDGGFGLRDGGPLAIGVSIFGVIIGSLFYALDFDQVERLIAQGAPEKESWRAAFGLTLTTVWVYYEILRLLSYLKN